MSGTSTEKIDYRTLVSEAEGKDYPQVEHDTYEFSKKTFKETDNDGHYNTSKPPYWA